MQTILNFNCQIYKSFIFFFCGKINNMEKNSTHSVFLESHRCYASMYRDLCIYVHLSLICRLDADTTARQSAYKCAFRGTTCFAYMKRDGHVSPGFSGDRIRSLAFADRSRASSSVKRFSMERYTF